MREAKQRRLAAKGWKTGDAKDFLGFSEAIRRARMEDADAIVAVLRRSIVELCVDDHHHDPGILGSWLQNKTIANARAWIEATGNFVAVAEGSVGLCGVASLSAAGTILLLCALRGSV